MSIEKKQFQEMIRTAKEELHATNKDLCYHIRGWSRPSLDNWIEGKTFPEHRAGQIEENVLQLMEFEEKLKLFNYVFYHLETVYLEIRFEASSFQYVFECGVLQNSREIRLLEEEKYTWSPEDGRTLANVKKAGMIQYTRHDGKSRRTKIDLKLSSFNELWDHAFKNAVPSKKKELLIEFNPTYL